MRRPTLRAIRGATTVERDEDHLVTERVQEMVKEILELNALGAEDLVSMIFTSTPDITSIFPAKAARLLGLDGVALLDALEPDVMGAPRMCVRVLVHAYTTLPRDAIKHVYLHGAKGLRLDLVGRQ